MDIAELIRALANFDTLSARQWVADAGRERRVVSGSRASHRRSAGDGYCRIDGGAITFNPTRTSPSFCSS